MTFPRAILLVVLFNVPAITLAAQSPEHCALSLQPTVTNLKTDHRAIQSYVQDNAALLYDEWSKSDLNSLSGNAGYEVYSAEFHDSKSSNQFQLKVNQRHQREQYQAASNESHTLSRKDLSDPQLKAWTDCLRIAAQRNPLVQLTPRNFTQNDFTLRVDIIMGTGQTTTTLSLQSFNALMVPVGSANSTTIVNETITAGDLSQRLYIVKRDPNAPISSDIRIAATIAHPNTVTNSDDILISLRATQPPPTADFMDGKWDNARAHIDYVLQAPHMRRDYYHAVLHTGSRYQAMLQAQQQSQDAVNKITAYGETRTELYLANKPSSHPNRVGCQSQELGPGQAHLNYIQNDPTAKASYAKDRQNGLNKLTAAGNILNQNPDGGTWLAVMDRTGCFAQFANGLP